MIEEPPLGSRVSARFVYHGPDERRIFVAHRAPDPTLGSRLLWHFEDDPDMTQGAGPFYMLKDAEVVTRPEDYYEQFVIELKKARAEVDRLKKELEEKPSVTIREILNQPTECDVILKGRLIFSGLSRDAFLAKQIRPTGSGPR